jgi:hypothetical protein
MLAAIFLPGRSCYPQRAALKAIHARFETGPNGCKRGKGKGLQQERIKRDHSYGSSSGAQAMGQTGGLLVAGIPASIIASEAKPSSISVRHFMPQASG